MPVAVGRRSHRGGLERLAGCGELVGEDRLVRGAGVAFVSADVGAELDQPFDEVFVEWIDAVRRVPGDVDGSQVGLGADRCEAEYAQHAWRLAGLKL